MDVKTDRHEQQAISVLWETIHDAVLEIYLSAAQSDRSWMSLPSLANALSEIDDRKGFLTGSAAHQGKRVLTVLNRHHQPDEVYADAMGRMPRQDAHELLHAMFELMTELEGSTNHALEVP